MPTIRVVIYKVEIVTVEYGAEVSLSHGKADTICKTLTQWTSGDFNAYVQYQSEFETGVQTSRHYHQYGSPLGVRELTSRFV